MKIVFFGTPEYVLPILESLYKTFKSRDGSPIVAVVTQKPKPTGRKKELVYTAIDNWAHKKKATKFYKATEIVENNIKADIGILAAYGEVVPKKVINHLPFGILNIHPSLLPKYRGASPVQAAILMGEKQTGVTITKMDEKLDMGQKISQFTKDIFKNDTTETLRSRLFKNAASVTTTLLPSYMQGKIKTESLGSETGSFTTLIKKEHGFIPPKIIKNAIDGKKTKTKFKVGFIKNLSLLPDIFFLERFVRALQPWPVAWTCLRLNASARQAKRLKILKAHTELQDAKRKTQDVKKAKKSYSVSHLPVGKAGIPHLVLDQVQLEGKNPVSWEQFISGYPEATF